MGQLCQTNGLADSQTVSVSLCFLSRRDLTYTQKEEFVTSVNLKCCNVCLNYYSM